MKESMWSYEYKDCPPDACVNKEKIESGKDFNGIAMNERYGWGDHAIVPKKRPRSGLVLTLLDLLGWGS